MKSLDRYEAQIENNQQQQQPNNNQKNPKNKDQITSDESRYGYELINDLRLSNMASPNRKSTPYGNTNNNNNSNNNNKDLDQTNLPANSFEFYNSKQRPEPKPRTNQKSTKVKNAQTKHVGYISMLQLINFY